MVVQQSEYLQWQAKQVPDFQNSNTIRSLQKGLDVYYQKVSTGGQRTLLESNLHINVLELLVIKLALLTFSKMFDLKSVHFQVGNMSAFSYLKIGGTQSKGMIAIYKEICEFAMSKEIMLTAEYLSGRLNDKTEWASRNFQDLSKWLLFPRVFQEISVKWGFPELNLFASKKCSHILSYLSWKADPHSVATNEFQQS